MDVEGDPEQGFDYLVGMIVVQGDNEQRFSFWADNRDDEDRIFEQFLATVTQYQDFRVFAYGGYERAFLMRMRKRANRKAPVDRVLKALVNTLSLDLLARLLPHLFQRPQGRWERAWAAPGPSRTPRGSRASSGGCAGRRPTPRSGSRS